MCGYQIFLLIYNLFKFNRTKIFNGPNLMMVQYLHFLWTPNYVVCIKHGYNVEVERILARLLLLYLVIACDGEGWQGPNNRGI